MAADAVVLPEMGDDVTQDGDLRRLTPLPLPAPQPLFPVSKSDVAVALMTPARDAATDDVADAEPETEADPKTVADPNGAASSLEVATLLEAAPVELSFRFG